MGEKRVCSVVDCDRKTWARGLCSKHLLRFRRHGSTDDPRKSVADRFWEKVEKTDSCWLWTASVRRKDEGYGAFWFNGRHRPAQQIALMLSGVEVPEGSVTAHKCDNPSCVNPEHLFVTDQAGNMADKTAKERQARGAKNNKAKLSEEDVKRIREAHLCGADILDLASVYGVYRQTIWQVVKRNTWSHVA